MKRRDFIKGGLVSGALLAGLPLRGAFAGPSSPSRSSSVIVCDGSGHQIGDRQTVMALCALSCGENEAQAVSAAVADIKRRHGVRRDFVVRWNKVSPAKLAFYLDVLGELGRNGLRCNAVIADKTAMGSADYDALQASLLSDAVAADQSSVVLLNGYTRSRLPAQPKLARMLSSRKISYHTSRCVYPELAGLADLAAGALAHAGRGAAGSSKQVLAAWMESKAGKSLAVHAGRSMIRVQF